MIMNKLIKKLRGVVLVAGLMGLSLISLNAAAAVITFGTGSSGFGGSLIQSGAGYVGSDINLGSITAGATPNNNGSFSITDGKMNFDTAANVITIDGSVSALGITSQTLFSGAFDTVSYSQLGNSSFLTGVGVTTASADLLSAFGLDPSTNFEFDVYTIESNQLGEIVQSNMINESVVPIPAAAWLLGSALFALVGVARRQKGQSGA